MYRDDHPDDNRTRQFRAPQEPRPGYGEYQDSRYAPEQYGTEQYGTEQYGAERYETGRRDVRDGGASRARAVGDALKPTPDFAIGKYVASVVTIAVIGAIAAYFVAWIIDLIYGKFNETWAFGFNSPANFAAYAALAAIAGGALWYVLNIATAVPGVFYNWIVGLLLVFAVILPLLLTDSTRWMDGLATSIVFLVIGTPVLLLIGPVGQASVIDRRG